MLNDGLNPGTQRSLNYAMTIPALIAQTQLNQVKGVYPQKGSGAGIPAHVSDVRATVTNATVGSTCTVIITFTRNPADTAFSSAKVYVQGYNGTQSPTLLTAGSDSPVQVVLNNTGESVSIFIQASGNGGDALLTTAPKIAVKLPLGAKGFGVASSPLPIGFPPQAYGKNMIPNPGFEFNTVGAKSTTDIAPGNLICDGWTIVRNDAPSAGNVNCFSIQRQSVVQNSGGWAIQMIARTGITLAANTTYACLMQSTAKIPVAVGDIIRVSGFYNFAYNVVAGVTPQAHFGVIIFDSAGISQLLFVNPPSTGAAWASTQISLQMPVTVSGGAAPAYLVFFASNQVQNTTGSPIAVGANQTSNLYFDDLKVIVQNTAFDLTPINTAGTPTTTTAICNQHTNVSKQIDVSSSTMQFGDGTITYNSGTVTTSPALPSGPWFVYADDPTFSGGAVTYVATLNPADCNAANGRILFGEISLVNGTALTPGTGGGTGGGGPRGKGFNVP